MRIKNLLMSEEVADKIQQAVEFPRGKDVWLPDCEGPKLQPFRPFGHTAIEWVRQINEGRQAFVWKVRIDGVFYALKLHGFPHIGWLRPSAPVERMREKIHHEDSFYRECRAYGRLQEVGLEDLVVRCHGYVLLTPQQEKEVHELSYEELDSDGEELDPLKPRPGSDRLPVRGIVKEWVEEGTVHFDPRKIRQLNNDLKTINSVGIIVHDIKELNYMGGKLVDFNDAWTIPYHEVTAWQKGVAYREPSVDRMTDPSFFDAMIDAWNENGGRPRIWFRNIRSLEYYRPDDKGMARLRKRASGTPKIVLKGWPDPFSYDWKATQKARQKTRASPAGRANAGVKPRRQSERVGPQQEPRATKGKVLQQKTRPRKK
ncbi:kinetochore Sim4 complex subunit FTA2-domain-containing protein [Apodospora peruviana]|uniref:Kinetochore Sim4 complex subunit FTA2-domain-containing protein n=1 Tax=Apodospora peruviana TaxID=516989 RepID=A0AAE0IUC3_9PEZI|nr:kinetochore Sim4 complex subunit FTA2-domain-containing protein [Apodospora peruviana]